MFKQLLELTSRLIFLAHDTQQNKTEIKELQQEVKEIRQELRELTTAVQRLAFEIRRVSDHEASERAMMALRLQNELLLFERRLPSGQPEQGRSGQSTD